MFVAKEEKLPATLDQLDPDRLRRFFQYCRTANPAGRFGCTAPNARVAARPSSLDTIHRNLQALFRFLRAEAVLDKEVPILGRRRRAVIADLVGLTRDVEGRYLKVLVHPELQMRPDAEMDWRALQYNAGLLLREW